MSNSIFSDIDQELSAQGLRRANANESGWYVMTSGGNVWATDAESDDDAVYNIRNRLSNRPDEIGPDGSLTFSDTGAMVEPFLPIASPEPTLEDWGKLGEKLMGDLDDELPSPERKLSKAQRKLLSDTRDMVLIGRKLRAFDTAMALVHYGLFEIAQEREYTVDFHITAAGRAALATLDTATKDGQS